MKLYLYLPRSKPDSFTITVLKFLCMKVNAMSFMIA